MLFSKVKNCPLPPEPAAMHAGCSAVPPAVMANETLRHSNSLYPLSGRGNKRSIGIVFSFLAFKVANVASDMKAWVTRSTSMAAKVQNLSQSLRNQHDSEATPITLTFYRAAEKWNSIIESYIFPQRSCFLPHWTQIGRERWTNDHYFPA